MAAVYDEYKDKGLEMLALNVIPSYGETAFLEYLDRYGRGNYPLATDSDQRIVVTYGVKSLGETVFIDQNGDIARRAFPPGLSYEELKAVVEPLLQ